jgi:hypothetical protein
MSFDDSSPQLFVGTTTRRTVVKTGVKLAYAAPLVAVTMKMSAGGAAAVSGPTTSRVCSPELVFGPLGWGGWSCPAGTTAVGGEVLPAGAIVQSQQVAGPNSVWPHYTFGPTESGYVVQNSNTGQTLTVCVFCA